jgi:glycosyltransferase involved in cell wall biosynthesis
MSKREITKGKLSVIIPFVNEYPQIAFTVQSIFCELEGRADFEVICVDNFHKETMESQKRVEDKGFEYMSGLSKTNPWLIVDRYDKKLSHWQAKNHAVSLSSGEFLWFCDSHCVPSRDSVYPMFEYYRAHHHDLHGTLHLPLSYMLDRRGRELIYKLVTDLEKAVVHYSFTEYRHYPQDKVVQVPCMSTCGMMMSREIFDELGGWPTELGVYGGGENFINFTLAVLGYSINIFPSPPLYHYAAPRGYNWWYDDFHRNRCISSYMYGGEEFAKLYMKFVKGKQEILMRIYEEVIEKCRPHRMFLEPKIKLSIEEWVRRWAKS